MKIIFKLLPLKNNLEEKSNYQNKVSYKLFSIDSIKNKDVFILLSTLLLAIPWLFVHVELLVDQYLNFLLIEILKSPKFKIFFKLKK
ncbi:hypothetical protein BpHYR1_021191 [Brachionus plicatilis]|uniref:Uncharacterized protein n=1 Tax=Brachionus plicatilis TaxID=10195 RepID=A0A3M7TB65_BRAPC|nr:hypothetical protein BpHYR1_021191 [Brachionus plicatilis]